MHKKITKSLGAALIAVSLVSLAACSSGTNPSSSNPPSQSSGDITKGGRLSVAFTADNGCIDPPQTGFIEDRIIIGDLADTLTDQDPTTLEIVPYLAESWDINADATQYTFHLKPGITFSDGTPLDAQAVATQFNAINELGPKASAVQPFLRGFAGTEVVDATTVKITFSEPNVPFLQSTTNRSLAILSPASWDKTPEQRCTGDWVGSGLFTLDSYVPQETASLSKRAGYAWASAVAKNKGEAYLDGVDYTFITEPSVQVGSLTSGQLDVAWPRAALSEADQKLIKAAGGYIQQREMAGISETQLPNTDEGHVLHDLYARQALVKAIDFKSISTVEYWDGYPSPTSIIPETTPGWVDHSAAYEYDPEGAKKLLEDNGWTLGSEGYYEKDGKRFKIVWLVFTNVSSISVPQLVQDQLKQVGIEVEIAAMTTQELGARVEAGTYDIGNTASTRADPDILRTIFDLSYVSKTSFAIRAQSPEVGKQLTDLFSQEFAEVDPAKRLKIVAEIQDILIDQVVAFPLNARIQAFGFASRVHDVGITAENLQRLNDAWVS